MNPREKRLLEVLVNCDHIEVRDLRELIGALNPAQLVFQLRKDGWAIQTGWLTVHDRDGELRHPGFYFLEPEERCRAIEFLERAGGAGVSAPQTSENTSNASEETFNNDDSKGGENDQPS